MGQSARSEDTRFIVKVQLEQFGTGGRKRQCLIYNQRKDIVSEHPASKELIKLMNGEPKKFFWAKLVDTKIQIEEEAPWQLW